MRYKVNSIRDGKRQMALNLPFRGGMHVARGEERVGESMHESQQNGHLQDLPKAYACVSTHEDQSGLGGED